MLKKLAVAIAINLAIIGLGIYARKQKISLKK
jgi:hypothetical protein